MCDVCQWGGVGWGGSGCGLINHSVATGRRVMKSAVASERGCGELVGAMFAARNVRDLSTVTSYCLSTDLSTLAKYHLMSN